MQTLPLCLSVAATRDLLVELALKCHLGVLECMELVALVQHVGDRVRATGRGRISDPSGVRAQS